MTLNYVPVRYDISTEMILSTYQTNSDSASKTILVIAKLMSVSYKMVHGSAVWRASGRTDLYTAQIFGYQIFPSIAH